MITFNGITMPIYGWAKRVGIKCQTLNKRLTSGWTTGRALLNPIVAKQTPGQFWHFKCGHEGILPKFGESNSVAYFQHNRSWVCAICSKAYRSTRERLVRSGLSELGIIGKIKILLLKSRYNSTKHSYATPNFTAEQVFNRYKETNRTCNACGREIDIYKPRKVHIDHDHRTGEFRGLLCYSCNFAEGFLKNHTDIELNKFFHYIKNCRYNYSRG